MHVCTWQDLADPADELDAACVTVNFALNKEFVDAISRTNEGHEAEGCDNHDGRFGHCES